MPLIDLSGQKYGQLTVLHLTGDVRSKSRCWLCQCTCGNTKVATTNELRSGGITSCGCRKSNLTGKRYGKLTVQKLADNKTWICQCDCGKRITVRHDGTKWPVVYIIHNDETREAYIGETLNAGRRVAQHWENPERRN